MKVVGYYYLSFPDSSPADPAYAATEMYVEVAGSPGWEDTGAMTFAFQVYTFRFVEEEFIKPGRPVLDRSVLIVPTLEDEWMAEFLDSCPEALAASGDPR